MPNKIQVNRVTNANVYVDGNNLLGRSEEITAPTVKFKNSEHKALGMIGVVEFFSGIDKLESKIKWNSFYPEVMRLIADPTKVRKMQIRASLETYTGEGRTAQIPVKIFMNVQAKDIPLGAFKQHDNVELETNFSVYYYRLEIDDEVITEVDMLSNIFKVNGVDILAEYRANLGID
jgi:P2 family phage contractile tail tube protein